MSDVTFEIKIKGEGEVYFTFKCHFCESEFKIKASEFQGDNNVFTELYCVYCGVVTDINTLDCILNIAKRINKK